jgi:putative FmdB family regulatory protein
MRYDFRCDTGHVSEVTCSMTEVPATVECATCGEEAQRVFSVPIIHFRGPGFYSTDVKGALHRKRRANAGDGLKKEFDSGAARIADAI